jgi:hypothetical protein
MDLADLGAGYVMYFKLVIFLGFLMVVFSIINVIKAISNTSKGHCLSDKVTVSSLTNNSLYYTSNGYPVCSLDWITSHSIANYGIQRVDSSEKAWVFIFFLVYWFMLSGIKSYIKKTNKLIDINNDTPSDWTLIVKGLPKDEPIEMIKANFEQFGANQKMECTVYKVVPAYDCGEYLTLQAKVSNQTRAMKIMQVKETPDALQRMKEKLAKDGKTLPNVKELKIDKSFFSPEFQQKMENLTDDTRSVGSVNTAKRVEAQNGKQSKSVCSRNCVHHIQDQADRRHC